MRVSFSQSICGYRDSRARSGGKMSLYIALGSSMRKVTRSRFGHVMGFFFFFSFALLSQN